MIFFSPIYLFLVAIPSLLIALWAQAKVKNAMAKYNRVANRSNLTGAQAARKILDSKGLVNVKITTTKGWLGDHYNPVSKELRLSPGIYSGKSLAAVGIAAHEAGHALQQATKYIPLALRGIIVPMASISNFAWPLLIIGIIFKMTMLVYVAVIFFFAIVILQIINLPVEYNASRRAKQALINCNIVTNDESEGVKNVLNAAALTYVAAALGSILQLLYFIGLGRRN